MSLKSTVVTSVTRRPQRCKNDNDHKKQTQHNNVHSGGFHRHSCNVKHNVHLMYNVAGNGVVPGGRSQLATRPNTAAEPTPQAGGDSASL